MIEKFTSDKIARVLMTQVFERKYFMTVPNCYWTGYEADLLCVTEKHKVIDIEIKISVSDFKADAKKSKWYKTRTYDYRTRKWTEGRKRVHPPKVWKHYFAMPEAIWKPELVDFLPSEACGVILLYKEGFARIVRKAKPNKDATILKTEDILTLARLTSMRYWDLRSSKA